MKKSAGFMFLVFALSFSRTLFAIDASNITSGQHSWKNWSMIEFSGADQLMYRLATTSTSDPSVNLVFDALPSKQCELTPALLILQSNASNTKYDSSQLLASYRLPGDVQPETESVK